MRPKKQGKSPGSLDTYRAKRSADRTPEPFGPEGERGRGRGVFVVHKHAASRLHYDLRLEWDGVLLSWAVPRGPSFDPNEKRLAVQTEPHPLNYADFEGLIPKGNYGAGAMILWDRGTWVPAEDPSTGFERGKFLFDLKGYKLRGRWTLVKTARGEKEWLLIKKEDFASFAEGTRAPDESSVLSGLSVEQLRDGADRAADIRADLDRLGAVQRDLVPLETRVMLAKTADAPFSDPQWLFELKYDGFRAIVARERGGQPRVVYRSGRDATATYPELAKVLGAQPWEGLVMDGEIVILDAEGKPDFQQLLRRHGLARSQDIDAASVRLPATVYVFDLLGCDGYDLRGLALRERKRILQQVLPSSGPLRFSDHIDEQGVPLFEKVGEMGLEGIMAKRADSGYTPGRSDSWLKVTADRFGDFVVVGYTSPRSGRSGFGALHLAVWEGDGLVYAGRAGSGFSQRELDDTAATLQALGRDSPPCAGPDPAAPDEWPAQTTYHWVEPELICEVKFKTWTDSGLLRIPVFLRFRDDKMPSECVRVGAKARVLDPAPTTATPPPSPSPSGERDLKLTRQNKVFWPTAGYTKGDLVGYYRDISPWLLPYLLDRPIVMTRYPDGIDGKSFFQKDAPTHLPDWVRRERMWSEHTQRQIDYLLAEDAQTLMCIANMASIPLHIWSSRIGSLTRPDWCVIDLDPKGAPFEHVVRIAIAVGALCDEIGFPAFPKTSGSTGLHVYLPLGGQCTYEQSRMIGMLIAKVIVAQLPDIATVERKIDKREGKVYLDTLQNGHGQLVVSPFSVRPRPGATVSTPLLWEEVVPGLDPGRFTIRTVLPRVTAMGDPMRGVLDANPDLGAILAALSQRITG